jgi:circadian clock protein KaiB
VNKSEVSCKLYVAGQAPNSRRAIENLKSFCDAYLPKRHVIAIVDVLVDAEQALADRILLTPTLLILSPAPVRSIVGDLSEVEILLQILGPEIDMADTLSERA